MAYVQNKQNPLAQGSPGTPISGSGAFAGGAGGSVAQHGTGGTPGFTNIQDYLGANSGNMGASNLLQNQVGGAFQGDVNAMQGAAQNALNQGQSALGSLVSQGTLGSQIHNLGNAYSFGTPTADYQSQLGNINQELSHGYGGPTQFNYDQTQYSQPTQNYMQYMGNGDQGFGQLMNSLYNQQSGGQLTPGQSALQRQFETNDSNFQNAKSNVLQNYANLQNAQNTIPTQTTQQLGNYANQWNQNQQGLKDYLSGLASTDMSNMGTNANNLQGAYNKWVSAGGLNPGSVGWTGNNANATNVFQNQPLLGQYNAIENVLGGQTQSPQWTSQFAGQIPKPGVYWNNGQLPVGYNSSLLGSAV